MLKKCEVLLFIPSFEKGGLGRILKFLNPPFSKSVLHKYSGTVIHVPAHAGIKGLLQSEIFNKIKNYKFLIFLDSRRSLSRWKPGHE